MEWEAGDSHSSGGAAGNAGVRGDILVPSSTAAHPAPLQGTGAQGRLRELKHVWGKDRRPWLEKRSRFGGARCVPHEAAQSQHRGGEQERQPGQDGQGCEGTGPPESARQKRSTGVCQY